MNLTHPPELTEPTNGKVPMTRLVPALALLIFGISIALWTIVSLSELLDAQVTPPLVKSLMAFHPEAINEPIAGGSYCHGSSSSN